MARCSRVPTRLVALRLGVGLALLVGCDRGDGALPPLDAPGRAMLDDRRARALDRAGIVRLLLARGEPRGKRVADVGCGPGLFEGALARAVGPGGVLVLTDLRADYLEHARARARPRPREVRTIVAARDRVGLPAGSVDAVLLVQVDHLFGAARGPMLLEAFGALGPGGRLLVVGLPRHRVPDAIARALRGAGARVERPEHALRVPLAVLVADR